MSFCNTFVSFPPSVQHSRSLVAGEAPVVRALARPFFVAFILCDSLMVLQFYIIFLNTLTTFQLFADTV